MKKIILVGLSLAMCASVGNAYYDCSLEIGAHGEMCGSLRIGYEIALQQCEYSGKAEDCNKAMAAQARYDLCMRHCSR